MLLLCMSSTNGRSKRRNYLEESQRLEMCRSSLTAQEIAICLTASWSTLTNPICHLISILVQLPQW